MVSHSSRVGLIFFSVVVLCFPSRTEAQTNYRYWIPFVDTVHSGANRTNNQIIIRAFKNCTQLSVGTSVLLGGQDFFLDAGEQMTIERPTLQEGMFIQSNHPLQVQYHFAAHNYAIYEDGSLTYYVPEERYLGTEYTVPVPNTEIAVVATENNTQIIVGDEPPALFNAGEAKRYATLPVGTPISSDKPIAVVAVHYAEDFYSATYAETIVPHALLSQAYYVPRQKPYTLKDVTEGSGVYLTAVTDNTSVEAAGATYPLNQGESVFLPLTEEATLRSNQPVYAIYVSDLYAQDPWTDDLRHYQYAISLSSPKLGVNHAIISNAAPSSHGFPVVQVSITSLLDANEVSLFTNNRLQQTLPLDAGQTIYLNEKDIADWEVYPLVIASEKEIQVTKVFDGFWLGISETMYAGNVIGVSFAHEESAIVEVTASGPTTFCEGDSVSVGVTLEGGTSFQWFRDDDPISTDSSALVVTDRGAYHLQLVDSCGETRYSDTVQVSVNSIPDPPGVNESRRCGPGSVTLTASGASDGNYRWYSQDTVLLDEQTDAVFQTPSLDATTTYLVSVVESDCESEPVPVRAVVVEPPQADAGEDVTIEPGEEIQLQASGGVIYRWLPEEGLSDPNISNPVANPSQTTTYEVTVTTEDGCTDTDEVTVRMEGVSVPNVFTPNGDGVNDQWHIANIEEYPNCRVKVYDRWGQEVFASVGYSEAWDGNFAGRLLPGDVYFYVIDLGSDTHPGTLSGHVTLIR